MRPTLLLVSLLAVVPFISATPAPRDGAIFSDPVQTGSSTFQFKGCYGINTLTDDLTPEIGGAGNIAVRTCLAACFAHDYNQGGVGNNKCLCDKDAIIGNPVDKKSCKSSTCPANSKEFCGSKNSLALYLTS